MTQWHYADRNHQQCGPVDDAELVRLFRNGDIRLDSLVWHSGLPQWQALSDFSEALGLQAAAPASPYMPPASEVLGEEAVVNGGEVVYAGFWKRVAAYIIDGFIAGIVGGMIGGVIGAMMGAASWAIPVAANSSPYSCSVIWWGWSLVLPILLGCMPPVRWPHWAKWQSVLRWFARMGRRSVFCAVWGATLD